MKGLDCGRAAQEIVVAVRYLQDVEWAMRLGIVGFCMGGALTIIGAMQLGWKPTSRLTGSRRWARPPDTITAPGLIFPGDKGPFFSVPDARTFAERQQRREREVEVIVYPGADRAFFNNERPEAYLRYAANDAWCWTLDHFGRPVRVE